MITWILKKPYIKDIGKIQTKKFTFAVSPLEVPQLAPGPGIVFYMLWAMYLGNVIDPEASADVSGPLTRSGHSIVISRDSSVGTLLLGGPVRGFPLMMAC